MEYCTDSIVAIVEAALHNLETEHVKNVERNMSPDQFFEEFRHVRIKLPRRMGHSTAAIKLLLRHNNSLMVTPTEALKRHVMMNFFSYVFVNEDDGSVYNFLKENIFTCSWVDSIRKHVRTKFKKPEAKKYEMVIMDMANLSSSPIVKDEIIAIMKDKTKLFVELQ